MTFAARSWTRQSSVCAASTLRSDVSSAVVDWREIRVEDEGIDDDEEEFSRARFCAASRILVSVASFRWSAPTRDASIVCSYNKLGCNNA